MKQRILALAVLAVLGLIVGVQWLAAADPVVENMEFVDADIRDVFRSLGVAAKYNVLLTKDVQGTVTIPFQQAVSVKDAIGLIARTYEFDYRWIDERTVVIGKKATLAANFDANPLTRVFTLSYATVDEIEKALAVVMDTTKGLSKNPRTNQITVIGSQLVIENVTEIIAQMDKPMQQVNIEMRLEEINQANLADLGLDWNLAGADIGITPTGTITASGLISAKIKAMESIGTATLLSQPNVTCMDSQKATIFYGSSLPVGTVTTTKDASGGSIETWTVTYMDVGTNLTVQPRVNAEGVVTVLVTASVTSKIDEVQYGLNKFPVIAKRTTESMARLKDGQTLVLGGLTSREETSKTKGLPLLQRIPLLGRLFGVKSTTNNNMVMCVFLTPHIEKTTVPTNIPPEPPRIVIPVIDNTLPSDDQTLPLPAGTVVSTLPPPGIVGIMESPPSAPTQTEEPVTLPPTEMVPTAGTEAGGVSLEENAAGTPAITEPAVITGTVKPRLPKPEEIVDLPYTVRKGDTFSAIGRLFGVQWQIIVTYNKTDKNAVLQPGQAVRVPIPDSHKYVVKPKETLWRIAHRYGVTVETLQLINSIDDATKISIGQVIVLPCGVDEIANNNY